MADITSIKNKEPLVIVGTVTSVSGGTWAGDWNDIITAFLQNKPVYFKLQANDTTLFIPVISLSNTSASSSILYFNNMMVIGTISSSGTFVLRPVE